MRASGGPLSARTQWWSTTTGLTCASALAARPALLLLDEPLSNLDALLRVELRAQLRLLHRKLRFTGVHVTHDQEEAIALGTRVAVMNAGRIEQIGDPSRFTGLRRPNTSPTSSAPATAFRFSQTDSGVTVAGQRVRGLVHEQLRGSFVDPIERRAHGGAASADDGAGVGTTQAGTLRRFDGVAGPRTPRGAVARRRGQ